MMQDDFEFSNTRLFVSFSTQTEGMLRLSPRPSTTLGLLETTISYFLELALWVDVESSLKNPPLVFCRS